jgi:hypothetical protein
LRINAIFFTKTGSGQTWGKHSKSRPFSQAAVPRALEHELRER